MIQDILTYLTVTAAIAYTLYSFWRVLFSSKAGSACSSGCSSCGSSKSDIFKALESRQKGPAQAFRQIKAKA